MYAIILIFVVYYACNELLFGWQTLANNLFAESHKQQLKHLLDSLVCIALAEETYDKVKTAMSQSPLISMD